MTDVIHLMLGFNKYSKYSPTKYFHEIDQCERKKCQKCEIMWFKKKLFIPKLNDKYTITIDSIATIQKSVVGKNVATG